MGSVAQAVDGISLYAGEPKPRVKAVARYLIDTEMLPKSVGRRPAQINALHLATLLVAVSVAGTVNDAKRCAIVWGRMMPDGEPDAPGTPEADRRMFLMERLAYTIQGIWQEGGAGPLTDILMHTSIALNATRPHAVFSLGDSRTEYFPVGAEKEYPGIQRIVHIPGAALRRIALSVYDGVRHGPVVPLESHAAEPDVLEAPDWRIPSAKEVRPPPVFQNEPQ